MIATLSGKISTKQNDSVVLDVGGVGYEVFLALEDLQAAKVGQQATYVIYEHIREDAHNLHGFSTPDARQVFVQLLSVSGIGPKVAMAVLSATAIGRLKQAIAAGDPQLLKGVAGVGKKTAERIILELRGKLSPEAGAGEVTSGDSAYQALISLGYTPVQAADAVAKVPEDVTEEQARIKAALRNIQ